MPEFQGFPKIARLNRNIVITEKVDGTNAAIGVIPCADNALCSGRASDCRPLVYAQSRTRIITPKDDNFGFAQWVAERAEFFAETLGEGLHFGEWWGSGIQRGYGRKDREFTLFNTARWAGLVWPSGEPMSVPVLYEGPFDQGAIQTALEDLRANGSRIAPGFMKPEGIVVYMVAARTMFKVTLEHDESPKGQVDAG